MPGRDHDVAAAVGAAPLAERHVDVERERLVGAPLVASQGRPVVGGAEARVELGAVGYEVYRGPGRSNRCTTSGSGIVMRIVMVSPRSHLQGRTGRGALVHMVDQPRDLIGIGRRLDPVAEVEDMAGPAPALRHDPVATRRRRRTAP